jgi:hypothetical protein
MNKVYFYMNNPCVIVREVTSDIVEIQLSHKFAEGMDLRGRCEGCCIGDSDNKITCTCDEFEWIIEEVQEEENKIVAMVERRLLAENPIEKMQLDKVKSRFTIEADAEKDRLNKTKVLHSEWQMSLENKKLEAEALEAKCNAAELEFDSIRKKQEDASHGANRLIKKYQSMLVYISGSNEKITKLELDRMKYRDAKLSALEAGGVDNWEWYDESLKDFDNG